MRTRLLLSALCLFLAPACATGGPTKDRVTEIYAVRDLAFAPAPQRIELADLARQVRAAIGAGEAGEAGAVAIEDTGYLAFTGTPAEQAEVLALLDALRAR